MQFISSIEYIGLWAATQEHKNAVLSTEETTPLLRNIDAQYVQ